MKEKKQLEKGVESYSIAKNLTLLFVLFIFLISHQQSSAQAMLGYTKRAIEKNWKEAGYTLKSDYFINKDGNRRDFYMIQLKNKNAYYFFDKEAGNICTLTVIEPLNQGEINRLVEEYNNQYVIISDTEWKMYSYAGGIIHIKLKFLLDSGPYFCWYIEGYPY